MFSKNKNQITFKKSKSKVRFVYSGQTKFNSIKTDSL